MGQFAQLTIRALAWHHHRLLRADRLSTSLTFACRYLKKTLDTGVAASAAAGAAPYPMVPYIGLLHTALGAELADFMQGKESAEQALAAVEAAYTTAAKEQGFLN